MCPPSHRMIASTPDDRPTTPRRDRSSLISDSLDCSRLCHRRCSAERRPSIVWSPEKLVGGLHSPAVVDHHVRLRQEPGGRRQALGRRPLRCGPSARHPLHSRPDRMPQEATRWRSRLPPPRQCGRRSATTSTYARRACCRPYRRPALSPIGLLPSSSSISIFRPAVAHFSTTGP